MAERSNAADSKTVTTGGLNPSLSIRIGLKDCFNVFSIKTGLGLPKDSKLSFKALRDSTVYSLLKANERINPGHQVYTNIHCTPFMVGTLDKTITDKNGCYYGASSSGSAKEIHDGNLDVSICTDTGSSALLPAARIGCLGFRPSYGRVSRAGLVPLCTSLDVVSIISRSFLDLRTIYNVIDKADPRDPCSTNRTQILKDLVINMDPLGFSDTQLDVLKKIHPSARVASLDLDEDMLAMSYALTLCPDFFSNLNRFNGFHSSENRFNASEFNEALALAQRNSLPSQIKARILMGALLLKETNAQAYGRLKEVSQAYLLKLKQMVQGTIWITIVDKNLYSNELHHTPYIYANNLLQRCACVVPIEGFMILISAPQFTDNILLDYVQNLKKAL